MLWQRRAAAEPENGILVGGSEVGGSDGEDLMFGLATMAAVHYLSGSSALMRPSAEMEEERA